MAGRGSPWGTEGGSRWRRRLRCGRIMGRTICGGWRGRAGMRRRRGGSWLWRRSETARAGRRRRGSAGSASRSSATGCCASTPRGRPAWWTARCRARTPLLTSEQRAALAQVVEVGPKPELHGAVRWRLVDLMRWLRDEFDVCVSRQTLGRELRRMGFGKLSARPRDHAQDPEELEAFKKTFPPSWKRSGRRCRRTPQSRSGGRTKHGQARRTASRADGRGAARGPARRTTSARPGPTSSAPSARPRERRRAW